MSKQIGLSECQARMLLQLAKDNNTKAKVRTFCKTSSQHAGRAFLLHIANKYQAIIQPFNHGKEEVVSLSDLDFWKGGNSFDITAAINATEEKRIVPSKQTIKFVIYSEKMKCVWGGATRHWVKDPLRAASFASIEAGQSTAQKLREIHLSDDAQIMEISVAHSKLHENQVVAQTVTEVKIAEKPSVMTAASALSDKDLEAILNFDAAALAASIDECKKIAQELADIDALRIETESKLANAKNKVRSLMQCIGKSEKKTVGEVVQKPTRKIAPRGLVQNAILSTLQSSSRLDRASIISRVMGQSPTSSKKSVDQAIRSMWQCGLLEQHENGFSLTAKGRARL